MARTRNIKPAFFDNDILGSLPALTRLMFIGLWCIADREGRLEDRPRRIKKTILGYDDISTEETDDMLEQLNRNGFILRYQVEGTAYIQIINFTKHQNPHMKEKESEIPPPTGFDPGTYSSDEYGGLASATHGAESDEDEENNDEGQPDTEPKAKKASAQEERFEQFWMSYPSGHKKKKQTAWSIWRRLKPTETMFKVIMDGLDRAKRSQEWAKENGQYIPNPTTWLNGGCWDDDYMEVTQDGTAGQSPAGGYENSAYEGRQGTGTPEGFKPD